jgi:RES domain-containing protein
MKPHAEYERITQLLHGQKEKAAPWTGVIYRSTSPRHFTPTGVLSGEGSSWRGGRWNPPGIKAVYGSLTPETAMTETLRHYRYYEIPIMDAMPKVFVAIKLSVQRSLDLTSSDALGILGVPLGEILDEDWRAKCKRMEESLTQAIGRAAFSAGFEALIAPSSEDRTGTNVIVYPDALSAASRFEVMGM